MNDLEKKESSEDSVENKRENTIVENMPKEKKKISLADFKVKSFVTKVKIEQMQFLKTAGG